MQTGDKIIFGEYEWRTLDIQNNAALIITENIIEWLPYHDKYIDVTWSGCALRKYLNGEFYDRFSETDRAKIIPVTNKNPDNEWYGTNGGEETQDRIFLLSVDEAACKYFGDSSRLLYNKGKNQRYWFSRKDENNIKRIAKRPNESWNTWWWLRTPGRDGVKAVYIHGDGNIGIQGNNIHKGNIGEDGHGGGVRPALWAKL